MKIMFRGKTWELQGRITAKEGVEKVGLLPEAVLVVRNGELVTEDTVLKDEDEVNLIAVISGGGIPC